MGIKVSYSFYGLLVHQKKFIRDLLHAYDCDLVSPIVSPLELSTNLKADYGDLLHSLESYRSLVGKLNILTHTRPDLCFAVQHLSQFLRTPRVPQMHVALHLIRYLKGTADFGFFLNNSPSFTLTAHCDSEWAA